MRVRVRADDPRPIYMQIVGEIRRSIALGLVEGDDPLPSVRRLAAELRVNPNTVQQAYRELEREGVIYVRRGQGTFVSPAAVPTEAELDILAEEVAERALEEADRYGVAVEELIAALRRVAARTTRTHHSTKEEPS